MTPHRFGWLALAPTLLAACFGTGEIVLNVSPEREAGGSPDTSTGQGGGDAALEASEGSHDVTDAGDASDGGSEAAMADGGPGVVAVKVTSLSNPEPGVVVFFSAADGSLLSTKTTDSQGQASDSVAPGSMVTALLGSAQNWVPVTIAGVQPGDVLEIPDPSGSPPAPPPFSFGLTGWPTSNAPNDGGAVTFYEAYGPCSYIGYPATQTPPVSTSCTWSGPFPVLLVASQVVSGQPQSLGGFVFDKTPIEPADGGTLDLSLDQPWKASEVTSVDLSHASPGNTQVHQYDYADGWQLQVPQVSSASDVDAGTQTVTFENYPGYPDFVQTEVDVSVTNLSTSVIASRSDALPASVNFDLSTLLPAILAGGLDTVTDPARPTASWTPLGSLSSADGTFVEIWDNAGAFDWVFVVPPGATTLKVPVIPPNDGGLTFSPQTDALYFAVSTIDADAFQGFADFRKTAGSLALYGAGSAPMLPAGVTTYRSTTYAP